MVKSCDRGSFGKLQPLAVPYSQRKTTSRREHLSQRVENHIRGPGVELAEAFDQPGFVHGANLIERTSPTLP
jgi:hypothetical protein